MVIEINKNIDNYKESVVLGLTAKQLIFSLASVIVGGGIVLLLYKHVGLTTSTYIAIPAVAPIALSGFYSYNGMSFMEMMKRKLHFAFGNRALTYISTENEGVIDDYYRQMEIEANKADKKKTNENPVEKDFDSSKKTMLLTVVMMLVMLAGLVGFAVWFKYLR